MRTVRWILPLGLVLSLGPGIAQACVYPGSLRTINSTLLTILNGGGAVSVHHRDALRRGLGQLDAATLLRVLEQDVPRRDARAARAVLETAQALAAGRGVQLQEAVRDDITRLASAADAACSGVVNAATGTENADGAEQGTGRQTGQGGRPLTFREGVFRLSLTFTIYLTFLAFLLGVRRQVHERQARLDQDVEHRQAVPIDRSPT